jgi:predicted kinase
MLEGEMRHNPILILLCGLSFAGKTTLAKALAQQLGWRYISLDAINTERNVGLDGQAIPVEQWEQTYAEAYRRVAETLRDRRSVIYDETNFARHQRDALRVIAAGCSTTTYVVYVATSAEEARRRWQRNRMTQQRGDVRDDDFAYVIQHFEPPGDDEATIVCDARHSLEEWIEQVINRAIAGVSDPEILP